MLCVCVCVYSCSMCVCVFVVSFIHLNTLTPWLAVSLSLLFGVHLCGKLENYSCLVLFVVVDVDVAVAVVVVVAVVFVV